MAFNPTSLPASVYEAYKHGPMYWPWVVERAHLAGITNPDKIADIVFYLHHPERVGRPLESGESALIKEWKGFRYLIKLQLDPKEVSPSTKAGAASIVSGALMDSPSGGNVEFEWKVEEGES